MAVTKLIQVTNISPAISEEQMLTLFGFVGKIEAMCMYPSMQDLEVASNTPKICYIKFFDATCVGVSQYLTNTVFNDRALVVTPVEDGLIPNEEKAKEMAAKVGLPPTGNKAADKPKSEIVNLLEGTPPNQVIVSHDPRLEEMGLPKYPPIPASYEGHIIEEIRRTVLIIDINVNVTTDELIKCFEKAGDIKYMKFCSRSDNIRYALIEFVEQSHVIQALKMNGHKLKGTVMKVYHSTQAITKPETKSNEVAQQEVVEALTRVKEAESLILAAIDPFLSFGKSKRGRSRSKSPRRTRNRKSRSRSRRRSRSRSQHRRRVSPKIGRSRSRSRHRRLRSKSPRRQRKSRSKSPSRTQRKSRSKTPSRAQRKSRSKTPSRAQRKSRSKSPSRTQRKSRSKSPPRTQRKSRSKSPPRMPRKSRSKSPSRTQRKSRSRSPRARRKSRSKSPRTKRKIESKSPIRLKRKSRSKSPIRSKKRSRSKSPSKAKRKSRSPHSKRRSRSRSPKSKYRPSPMSRTVSSKSGFARDKAKTVDKFSAKRNKNDNAKTKGGKERVGDRDRKDLRRDRKGVDCRPRRSEKEQIDKKSKQKDLRNQKNETENGLYSSQTEGALANLSDTDKSLVKENGSLENCESEGRFENDFNCGMTGTFNQTDNYDKDLGSLGGEDNVGVCSMEKSVSVLNNLVQTEKFDCLGGGDLFHTVVHSDSLSLDARPKENVLNSYIENSSLVEVLEGSGSKSIPPSSFASSHCLPNSGWM